MSSWERPTSTLLTSGVGLLLQGSTTRNTGQKPDRGYSLEIFCVRKFLWLNGASGRARTYNLLIRSQKLYPIELRTHLSINDLE